MESTGESAETILRFWFGTAVDDLKVAEERGKLWWKKNPRIDGEIRERFAGVLGNAVQGQYDDWLVEACGRLALIILADQFSRNIYRGTPQAFTHDPLALFWSKDGIASGLDQQLRPIERVFFYMPFEHSEAIEDQHQSVALFEALATGVVPEKRKLFN
ncbi:MAG: DUF924 family protein, partial [Burkholderiales bacterium]|nr:DUF924 family protein [Burkholderiales bacterium]